MKVISRIFLILVLATSIDTLLYAWFGIDLVFRFFPDVQTITTSPDGIETVTTAMSMGSKVVYSAFGIAGLGIVLGKLFGCKECCIVESASTMEAPKM